MIHSFNISIAKEFGIEEAILLHNLYFWIVKNATNGKHFHDGKYWTYNSNKAFSELFPYIEIKKVSRVMAKLENGGIIVKGNYNENPFDHTLWYAFTEQGLAYMNNAGYDVSKLINKTETKNDLSIGQNDLSASQNDLSITNINNTDNIKEKEINNKLFIKKKKNSENLPLANDFDSKWQTIEDKLLSDKLWADTMQRTWGISCKTILDYFKGHIVKQGKADDVTVENPQNMKRWCNYSAPYFLQGKSFSTNLGTDEYIREGKRYYKFYGKEYTAPMDAPARPSAVYVWCEPENKWVYDGI